MNGFDASILYFIQNHMRSGVMDTLMVVITHLGDFGIIWLIIAAVLLFFGKTRHMGIAILVAVGLAFLIGSLIVKPLVARPRPCDVDATVQLLISRPHGYSFPSGHTTAAFAAATILFLYRSRWRIPAGILAVLIAFSRLYLFVHYPTDVLTGMALGILCGFASWWICARFNSKRRGARRC